MKRKLLTILLLLSCVIGMQAQRFSYNYNRVNFKCKLKDGTVCITGFDRNVANVIVPAIVSYHDKNYPVVKIDTYISGDNYSTTTLMLEEGIREIANYCFIEFRKLQTVVLPNSIRVVGKNAFAKAEEISNLQVSEQVGRLIFGPNWNVDVASGHSQASLGTVASPNPQEVNKRIAQSDHTLYNIDKVEESAEEEVDVDIDIPKSRHENEYSFAIIIANEKYDVESPVEFAINDGRVFKAYCQQLFGMPEENIRLLENASYMQIKRTMEWLKRVTKAYAGVCKVYFYYAGHGMPDEKQRTAYLLPTDGYASDIAVSGYSLKELYALLGALPAESVTVFLDACFSGLKRDGDAILAARSVAIEPEEETLTGKVMVFSATSEAETAYAYKRKGHGMFTYFLLKKLKETRGNITYGELSEYIRTEVMRKSLTLNDKEQTPTVSIAPTLESTWKHINFNINSKK